MDPIPKGSRPWIPRPGEAVMTKTCIPPLAKKDGQSMEKPLSVSLSTYIVIMHCQKGQSEISKIPPCIMDAQDCNIMR
jgi:hypothetical protein